MQKNTPWSPSIQRAEPGYALYIFIFSSGKAQTIFITRCQPAPSSVIEYPTRKLCWLLPKNRDRKGHAHEIMRFSLPGQGSPKWCLQWRQTHNFMGVHLGSGDGMMQLSPCRRAWSDSILQSAGRKLGGSFFTGQANYSRSRLRRLSELAA